MAEYQQKRWRCDFCGADVKRSVMPPRGWHEIGGFEVPETIAEALKRP